MRARRVELSIGALVIETSRPGDRYVCGDAFAAEMERLLREHGLPEQVNTEIGSIQLPADAPDTAAGLGRAVAQAIFTALSREEAR